MSNPKVKKKMKNGKIKTYVYPEKCNFSVVISSKVAENFNKYCIDNMLQRQRVLETIIQKFISK
jgi:hypothetical protein